MYLKNELTHYGTSVPVIRSVAKAVAARHPGLSHDDLVMLVDALWAAPVHERRMAAVELLGLCHDRLRDEDRSSSSACCGDQAPGRLSTRSPRRLSAASPSATRRWGVDA